ncbi:hypothetical protein [Citrifermentans bremense]|uniref:Uncharacterized protein n=1 Tax=Citrifermentans bremense TaxID=60035 RepID=A0A6S6M0V3_9BACT|nr:hypothetical protein [Citrifermentans bremense]
MKDNTSGVGATPEGVWTVPAVSVQPIIRLASWAVFEVETGERYFVGFNLDDQEGRVSTPIRRFDSVTGRAITESGRVYQIVGPAGQDPDGNWVWSRLMSTRNIKYRDVTSEYVFRNHDEVR